MATFSKLPLPSVSHLIPSDIICWEALHPHGKALRQARRIYKACLSDEERIPWRWIKDGLDGERIWEPNRWSCHLLLAGLQRRSGEGRRVIGFAYGAHVPGFGGYGGYLGVDPRSRGRGVGARLWRLLIQRLQLDADCAGVKLPFVVWESRAPEADATDEERNVWRSRLRLWSRLGAWRVGGVRFLSPNCADRHGPPVPLDLFLKPVDVPAAAFDTAALRSMVAGLHRYVYGLVGEDALASATLSGASRLSLQPLDSRAIETS